MKNSTKHGVWIGSLIALLAMTLLLFTNAAPVSGRAAQILAESKRLEARLDDRAIAGNARKLLAQHKITVSNHLAYLLQLESCSQLLAQDDTTRTGDYVLYPNGNSKPVVYHCEIENGRLVRQKLIRNANVSSPGNMRRALQLNMDSPNGAQKKYSVQGVYAIPKLIKKTSKGPCRPNVDFGFDDDAVWVKNDCAGKFSVPVVRPLRDRYLSGTVNRAIAIKGYLERADMTEDAISIYGWACELGVKSPVHVQLYAGGPIGTGTLMATALASNSGEEAVGEACDTPGKPHRFKAKLSFGAAAKYTGKKIFAYAVASDDQGTASEELSGSGSFELPSPPSLKVIGSLAQLAKVSDGGYEVTGWACAEGSNKSIKVRISVGPDSDHKGLLTEILAGNNSEDAVADKCKVGDGNFRFRYVIPKADVTKHAGKKVWVNGMSPNGQSNLLLNNSGGTSLPPPPSMKVMGAIGPLAKLSDGSFEVKGWACAEGSNDSIKVRISVGSDGNERVKLTPDFFAANNSEDAVADSCKVGKGNFRFRYVIPKADVKKHAGKKVWINGMSPSGQSNNLLNNSGDYSLPRKP